MNENIKKKIEYPKEGILSKTIIKNDNVDVTLFCMAKDTEIGEHTSSKEGYVFVVEGDGVFNLKGKDIPMTPNTFIYLEKNALHSLNATKNTSFLLTLFS